MPAHGVGEKAREEVREREKTQEEGERRDGEKTKGAGILNNQFTVCFLL